MVQDIQKFTPSQARVHRDENAAAHRHAKVRRQQGFPIKCQERDTIARFDPDILQTGGEGTRPLVKLPVREPVFMIHNRRF